MDKLEQYLDQVCRSIGGPAEMRRHVRQELREHLLDAVAQHKTAGLSDEAALAKALEEFGKPDEVRSELEAAHGQRRMMTVVIDKALDWKEKTMRAKWLWTTWAYLALAMVIALEVMFLTFTVMFLIPKFRKLLMDGMIDSGGLEEQGVLWMVNFLVELSHIGGDYTLALMLVPAFVWCLFEWRVQSENKTFMRLSALGTAAVALTGVVVITAASMVIPFMLAMPAMGVMAHPWAVEQVVAMETSFAALENAHANNDWPKMQERANRAWNAANLLSTGPAATSLAAPPGSAKAEDMRSHIMGAKAILTEAQKAIQEHDEPRLEKAMQDFRKVIEPLRKAVRPADGATVPVKIKIEPSSKDKVGWDTIPPSCRVASAKPRNSQSTRQFRNGSEIPRKFEACS